MSADSTNPDQRLPLPALLLCSLLAGCSQSKAYMPGQLEKPSDEGAAAGDAKRPEFPATAGDTLTMTGLEPASGPFTGNVAIELRGSGFTDDATVKFGDALVQPANTFRVSKNRLRVILPANNPGVVDVSVMQGDVTETLPTAFTYNALELTPFQGSISGGTLVDLTAAGATFDDKVSVEFDGQACTDLTLLTPQRLRCKSPRHDKGRVDVVVRWADGAQPELVANSAYEFIETLDAEQGGLSGGPVSGTLNVAVMSDFGFVIPGALVFIGNDPNTQHRGVTDMRGSVVFSGDDLRGALTIHAGAHCFQRGSIVTFDAQNATVILSAAFDPTCQAEGEGPGRRGALGSMISGELIFPGDDEFGVNGWSIVPPPRDSEVRVAYVFTSRASSDTRNPAPDAMGTAARLSEATAVSGGRGFRYRIFARPAGLAVYALAGIERTDTGQFTPYVMGIQRNIVTTPGEENDGVDLMMDISLDRELAVALSGYPAPTPEGPNEFRVRANVDLGGEGVIVREVGNRAYDVVTRRVGSDSFRFFGQPAFSRLLEDASYEVVAGYFTPETDVPLTTQRRVGVKQDIGALEITNFLGIPRALEPATGGVLPLDRKLRFSIEGESPDLIIVDITDGTGFPAWTLVLPGDGREVPVPDFSSLDGQSDLAPGFLTWTVSAVKIVDFNYNEFRYAQLSPRYFTHTAVNVLTARR